MACDRRVVTWLFASLLLLTTRWIDPPSTAVHIQRRLRPGSHNTPYHERYKFVSINQYHPTSSTLWLPRRTRDFTSIMGLTGTRSKLLPTKIWKAVVLVELPLLHSNL